MGTNVKDIIENELLAYIDKNLDLTASTHMKIG
jgi:hypothetical protein